MNRWLLLALGAHLVGAAVYLLTEWFVAGTIGPPIDDGWIYMAFARAIASGEGMTYAGHDGPVAAVTGPAWCAVLALTYAVFGDPVVAGHAAGIGVGLLGVWGTWRLARVVFAGDARIAGIAAIVVALGPRWVWGTTSFMEVPFYVWTVTWGLALHLERREERTRRWLPALVVLALAGWARPECFVFAAVAALDRRRLADFAWLGGLLALYPLYHVWVHGHPLPTTFYAKAAGGAPWRVLRDDGVGAAVVAAVAGPAKELAAFFGWLPTHLPLLLPGFVVGIVRGLRARSGVAFVAWAMLAFVAARGFLGFVLPWFQFGRYYEHLHALFVIVALAGFTATRVRAGPSVALLVGLGVWVAVAFDDATMFLFDWVPAAPLSSDDGALEFTFIWLPAAVAVAVSIAGLMLSRRDEGLGRPPVWALALYLVPALGFGAVRNAWNVRDTELLNVGTARIVRDTVPAGDVVACHDIGALGWFAERRLLDLAGLGSPEVTFRPRLADGSVDFAGILAEHRPQWLCLTQEQARMVNPAGAFPPGVVPVLRATLSYETLGLPHRNVTLAGNTFRLIELQWQ